MCLFAIVYVVGTCGSAPPLSVCISHTSLILGEYVNLVQQKYALEVVLRCQWISEVLRKDGHILCWHCEKF